MLSKQIIAVARGKAFLNARSIHAPTASAMSKSWKASSGNIRRAQFHSTNLLQAETVKVPQMAESITEGTLKSWSKQVGDTVAADEEVATIETDKIDVSVNAPTSGTIKELLANEEDTVTVGQDLFILEPGEVSESSASPPKEEVKEEKPQQETPQQEKPKESEPKKKIRETCIPSSIRK